MRDFVSPFRKYDRTREVISGFQSAEEDLKNRLETATAAAQKAEDRFQVLKVHAQDKLEQ